MRSRPRCPYLQTHAAADCFASSHMHLYFRGQSLLTFLLFGGWKQEEGITIKYMVRVLCHAAQLRSNEHALIFTPCHGNPWK